MSLPQRNMKREVFDFASTKPMDCIKVSKLLYHARGACLRPFRLRFCRLTDLGCVGSVKLDGWEQ